MLHVLSATDRSAVSDAVLGAMFAARRSVFVDLLKWDIPVIAARYEIDQFDDVHATYIVIVDATGAHMASARLLPTTRPHLLDSFYTELCDEEPPRGQTIFEITRFCLDRRLRARERRVARNTLVRTLADHALSKGIPAYSAIAERGWCAQILQFGWRCAALGPTKRIGSADLAALRIDIDAETPALLLDAGIGIADDLHRDVRAAA